MERDLLTTLLAAVPMPLILIGADDRILLANAGAVALFGQQIEGRHYVTVMRQPSLLDAIEGTQRHRQQSETRYTVSGPAREAIWKVMSAPVEGAGLRGVLVSFEDTSDLEQVGQMRRDFVANVSHELRTPLTALLGFIETLK
ncbi:two-component sensor histidine kinase, partial [Thioclava sp. BHET1]